jgi:beta-glucosidase
MHLLPITFLALATPVFSAAGDGDWAAAYAKAKAALAKLSNQDKVNMVTGTGWEKGPCVGNTLGVSSIGYPALCLQDGPLG